ncbi:MAG: hypothetical protein WBO35_03370 [Candidatus Saccharimonadales bacterium]
MAVYGYLGPLLGGGHGILRALLSSFFNALIELIIFNDEHFCAFEAQKCSFKIEVNSEVYRIFLSYPPHRQMQQVYSSTLPHLADITSSAFGDCLSKGRGETKAFSFG